LINEIQKWIHQFNKKPHEKFCVQLGVIMTRIGID